MIPRERALGAIGLSLWMGLLGAAPAGANPDTPEKDYLLTQPGAGRPTGARFMFAGNLPLPVGTDGLFTGGKMSFTGPTGHAGSVRPATHGPLNSTGPGIWPLLLIEPAYSAVTTGAPTAGKRIKQAATTAQGGAVQIPRTVLGLSASPFPRHGGVYEGDPGLFDVATSLSFQWPASAATLAPGAGPAPSFPGVATFMGPGGGTITYSRASAAGKSFGGPAIFAIAPGPTAGTRFLPPDAMGGLPFATIFFNAQGRMPTTASFLAVSAVSTGGAGRAAPGGHGTIMTSFGPVGSNNHQVNAGLLSCTMWCLGPNGTVMGFPNPPATATTWSIGPGFGAFPQNTRRTSEGFPWTTGFITVYAPGALGGITYFLVGSDGRGSTGTGMTGVGNLSLVSGALSTRNLSKANAERGFLSLNLPEPAAALGSAAALGMLALCHALVRRRSC